MDFEVDNKWVVPYNPFILKHFKCHINVVICESLQVIKYFIWYSLKGGTTAITSVGINKNEIAAYEDMRTIGIYSAVWRIFQFTMHERYPTCVSLTIHLEENNQVFFDEEDDMN